ncbi:hypothetical protein KCU79_g150, partial [Aureobasidium melanogenum]
LPSCCCSKDEALSSNTASVLAQKSSERRLAAASEELLSPLSVKWPSMISLLLASSELLVPNLKPSASMSTYWLNRSYAMVAALGENCSDRLIVMSFGPWWLRVEQNRHQHKMQGIPGGWSLVWNEKFTIVWFSTLAQRPHVLGDFAGHTDWIENWWLVSFWAWLAFQGYTESVAGESVAFLKVGIPQSSTNGQGRNTTLFTKALLCLETYCWWSISVQDLRTWSYAKIVSVSEFRIKLSIWIDMCSQYEHLCIPGVSSLPICEGVCHEFETVACIFLIHHMHLKIHQHKNRASPLSD